jgi:protein-tyrosine phosphatase
MWFKPLQTIFGDIVNYNEKEEKNEQKSEFDDNQHIEPRFEDQINQEDQIFSNIVPMGP